MAMTKKDKEYAHLLLDEIYDCGVNAQYEGGGKIGWALNIFLRLHCKYPQHFDFWDFYYSGSRGDKKPIVEF
jgi:hypothetical protein